MLPLTETQSVNWTSATKQKLPSPSSFNVNAPIGNRPKISCGIAAIANARIEILWQLNVVLIALRGRKNVGNNSGKDPR